MDRYVSPVGSDSNDGSARKPWRTINHAASAVHPGVTVHVATGRYIGSVLTTVSGKPDSRIRFISDERWAAQIVGDVGTEAVWENHGDYVDIVGFDISGSSPNGIENLASFGRTIGNRVHDIPAACDENGGAGINNANYAAHDNDVVANLVHDVFPRPGCSRPHGVGIYHSNARGRIWNNVVFHNGSEGIQLWHAATAVIVANNTVAANRLSGILVGAGDAPGGVTNDGTIVLNNIVAGNAAYGIQEFGSTGPQNTYFNNLAFANGRDDVRLLTGRVRGTIVADPQFTDNYHLSPKSPALNAAAASPNAPPLDFEGAPRPFGPAPDIGAYESGAPPGKWPTAWLTK